jgi:uncharacterized protein (TIGR02266 family)
MSEKRKSTRVTKKIKSEVRGDDFVSRSTAVDVSRGGIFISTPEPLGDGESVKLTVMLPDDGEVEVKGIVRWVRNDESPEKRAGMGIEFIDVDEETAKKLEKLLS